MTRETFTKIIDNLNRVYDWHQKLYDLGINIENEITYDALEILSKELIESEFGEDGYDWFSWWLYELPFIKKGNYKDSYALEPDGTPIVLDTADQLYDFLTRIKEENNVQTEDNS